LNVVHIALDELCGSCERRRVGEGFVERRLTLASCVKKIGGISSGLVDPDIVRVDDGGEIFVPPVVLLRMETLREACGKDVIQPLDLTIGAGVVGGGFGDVGP
jgi:hypothetical protein